MNNMLLPICLVLFLFFILLTYIYNSNKQNPPSNNYYLSKSGTSTYVLLHGIPGTRHVYDKLILELEQKDIRVLAPELQGDSINADVDYVHSLLDEFKFDNVTLVVHDRGGLVGMQLLQDRTEINRVVLLDTIITDFNPQFPQNSFGALLVNILYSNTFIGDFVTKQTFIQGGLETTDLHINFIPENKNHVRSFFNNFSTLHTVIKENKKILQEYQGEVIGIWGEHDPFLPKELHLTDTTFDTHIISNAQHYTPHTHAQEIVVIILGDTDDHQ